MIWFLQRFKPSTPSAYLFLMVTLLFGLPLLTAYTNVDSSFYLFILIPYLAMTISVTLVLILLSRTDAGQFASSGLPETKESFFMSRFNSISPYFVILVVSLALVSYSATRILVESAYPYPPSHLASLFGGIYIIFLVVSSILVFSRAIYSSFPVLSRILAEKKYAVIAAVSAVAFAVVYLLLVEQLVILGYNEPFYGVGPPLGQYPFLYVFTVGPQQLFVNFIYLPYVLIQINPFVSIFIVPFEMMFATLLALLTSTNITMAYYLIGNSGFKCCTRGTVMSTGGSILGLTATCPTCLVPSFVSVIFGGIAAGEAVYSNVYGAVLPPIVSVVTLVASLAYLSRSIRKRTNLMN